MNITLTGHTSGLGEYLYSHLEGNVQGFSRSNGYNINNREDRDKILAASEDSHVLINNAKGSGLAQAEMLYTFFKSWKKKEKHIINIGSRAAERCEFRLKPHPYSLEKKTSHIATRQLQNCDRKCKISNLVFAKLETNDNKVHYPEEELIRFSEIIKMLNLIISSEREIINLEIW